MTAPARFTQADMKRAAAGVAKAGLPVARVEVEPDGRIVVIIGGPGAEPSGNPLDRILDDAA